MAMSSAVLLASENEKLQVENQRQKRKRAIKRTYIAKGGVLSGAEGLSRAIIAETEQEGCCSRGSGQAIGTSTMQVQYV